MAGRRLASGADLANQRIINLGSPSNPTDAANKAYVDNVAAGLDVKNSVIVASTANLTLSGAQTIDGVSLAVGSRVLVKDQTTSTQNGIYLVASGAWTRSSDAVQGTLTPGALIVVEQGTVNADTLWLLTSDGTITVDTSPVIFTRFQAGVTYTFGNGLTFSAGVVSVNAGAGLIVDGTSLRIDPTYVGLAKRYAITTTATTNTITITHSLGTRDVLEPTVWDTSVPNAWEPITSDVKGVDANSLTITMLGSAPVSGQYRVVITA